MHFIESRVEKNFCRLICVGLRNQRRQLHLFHMYKFMFLHSFQLFTTGRRHVDVFGVGAPPPGPPPPPTLFEPYR